jgi:hypothetical protein
MTKTNVTVAMQYRENLEPRNRRPPHARWVVQLTSMSRDM